MKIFPDCIPCHISQSERISKAMSLNPKEKFTFYKNVCKKMSLIEDTISPVRLAGVLYDVVEELFGNIDVFKEEKKKSNACAEKILNCISSKKEFENIPLKKWAELAVIGNLIDLGAGKVDLPEIENRIIESMKSISFFKDDFEEFERRLSASKTLVYLLDNAGEAVFDLQFMKMIHKSYPNVAIKAAVRSKPVINDMTIDDAKEIGMEQVASIVNSGSPFPGIEISSVSDNFIKTFYSADIILSKGQGNFEGLNDLEDQRIFFCFVAKCQPISEFIGAPKGSVFFSINPFTPDTITPVSSK